MITAKSPYRLNLAGGFTDIEEYYKLNGGAVVEFAIDIYARSKISPASGDSITVRQEKLEVLEHGKTSDLTRISKFYRSVIERFPQTSGFELDIKSDVVFGSGLGSSSASLISMIGAFNELRGTKMSMNEIAECAYSIERNILKTHAGKQDSYASAFGGLNYITFSKSKVEVNRLNLKKEIMEELQNRVVMIGTGLSRTSHKPLGDVIDKIKDADPVSIEHLDKIKETAERMRSALTKGKIDEAGEIMLDDWNNKKALGKDISNEKIDYLFKVAMENGARGGKLLGAGSGGHFVFILNSGAKQKFSAALSKEGLNVESPRIVHEGLVVSRD